MKKTAALAAAATLAATLLTGIGSARADVLTDSTRAAETAHSATRAAGRYCLANDWGKPDVPVKPCNSSDQGQHWAIFNDQISLALA
ncbi:MULTISPECIES: hypothetical protein [Streptomyces]|uniref:Ricin B lectin domain-containing protein n=1 Tax=Streptomyces lienomycini TaxID=284035 RepID=A0ABV9X4T2_9ACTN|nr:hypothetical protein [Streptomyces lienomycini]